MPSPEAAGSPPSPPAPRRWWQVLGVVVFAAGSVVVIRHAVVEHAEARATRERLQKLTAALQTLQPKAGTDLHATVNGVMSHLTFTTAPQGIRAAAASVAESCGKDPETGGGDIVATGDNPHRRFVREAVHRDDAADGSASSVLCIFRSADTGERFERFTFVRGDAKNAHLTSVTRQSKADLAEMFPLQGDAPGDDLPGVPRPEGSRRVVSASVIETGHAVRIYDIARGGGPEELRARRQKFDEQMQAAGYASSPGVASKLDDVRLYVRGDDRIVVAFENGPDGTRVVINRTDLL